MSVYRTLAALDDLQNRGLCDARRLRLSLSGLAVATALTDEGTGGRYSAPLDVPTRLPGAQRVA